MDDQALAFYSHIASIYADTALRPLALALTLFMGLLLLVLPKRNAMVPIFVVMLSVTILQRVVTAGINWHMIRIMVLFGAARILLRRETVGRWTRLDSLLLLLAAVQVLTFTIQGRTVGSFVTALGRAFDMLGLYFLFRVFIGDFRQATFAIRALAVLAVPFALAMIVEQVTGKNFFSIFGGVSQIVEVRHGRLRSQGSFETPILAGTFGATLVPLLAGTWKSGPRARVYVVAGALASFAIAFFSSSSGPMFTLLVGVFGLFMMGFSGRMRQVRWLALLALIGLQLVMKSPIYSLLARVPLFSGSTGDYRFILIDAFVHHFRDWWLVGEPSTWYWGEGLFDITNQFIRVAVDGGLSSLLVFLAVIVVAFKYVGQTLHALKERGRDADWLLVWGLGVTLFAHIVAFLSVSYFDQIVVVWYMLLAMIPSLATSVSRERVTEEDAGPVPLTAAAPLTM